MPRKIVRKPPTAPPPSEPPFVPDEGEPIDPPFATDDEPPPAANEQLDFSDAEDEAPTPESSYQKQRAGEIDGIIRGIISLSPRKLYQTLQESQRIGSRELSVLYRALDDEDTHVAEALQLAMIARLEYERYEKTTLPQIEAEYRERAKGEMPTQYTADGKKEKKPTLQEVEDFMQSHFGEKLGHARMKLAELRAFSALASELAARRCFRPKTIEALLDAAKATGSGKTGGYGDDE